MASIRGMEPLERGGRGGQGGPPLQPSALQRPGCCCRPHRPRVHALLGVCIPAGARGRCVGRAGESAREPSVRPGGAGAHGSSSSP
eukprot:1706367-Prymnesium_polylepis.1